MHKIGRIFFKGIITILPIALTIYILYWLGSSAESLLGGLLKLAIPEKYYIPGMGVLAGFVLIILVGILINIWLVRRIFDLGDHLLEKIPLVKSLYNSFKDLVRFLDKDKQKEFNKVVMVKFDNQNTRMMGLVTREDFKNLPEGIGTKDDIAVYLPMSYQLGGFTVFVKQDQIQPVDMTIEQAMRFALTAAMSTEKPDHSPNEHKPAKQQ